MNLIANQAKYGQIKAFNFNILTWIEKMTQKYIQHIIKENLLLQNNLLTLKNKIYIHTTSISKNVNKRKFAIKNKYNRNIFLEKASYEFPPKIGFCIIYNSYIMIELTILK